MKSLKSSKLLALAAPAVLLFASPAAQAGGATAAPQHQVAPISSPAAPVAPAAPKAGGLAAFAAALRSIVAAAQVAPTQPMVDDDGCPLAGNVGKASPHDRCAMRVQTARR